MLPQTNFTSLCGSVSTGNAFFCVVAVAPLTAFLPLPNGDMAAAENQNYWLILKLKQIP